MKTIYTITKGYRIFEGEPRGEPIDEPNEQQLYAWLRARGRSDQEASEVIDRVNGDGSATVDVESAL